MASAVRARSLGKIGSAALPAVGELLAVLEDREGGPREAAAGALARLVGAQAEVLSRLGRSCGIRPRRRHAGLRGGHSRAHQPGGGCAT